MTAEDEAGLWTGSSVMRTVSGARTNAVTDGILRGRRVVREAEAKTVIGGS